MLGCAAANMPRIESSSLSSAWSAERISESRSSFILCLQSPRRALSPPGSDGADDRGESRSVDRELGEPRQINDGDNSRRAAALKAHRSRSTPGEVAERQLDDHRLRASGHLRVADA